MTDPTKKILLSVADGPDSIEIYTSEDKAVVDWAADCPALYLTATCHMNSAIQLGPFALSANLIKQLQEQLAGGQIERRDELRLPQPYPDADIDHLLTQREWESLSAESRHRLNLYVNKHNVMGEPQSIQRDATANPIEREAVERVWNDARCLVCKYCAANVPLRLVNPSGGIFHSETETSQHVSCDAHAIICEMAFQCIPIRAAAPKSEDAK